jgi:hypothetical protein
MMNKFTQAIALGLLAAAPALAQNVQTSSASVDARWTPYVGCWQIVQEHVGQEMVPVAPGLRVCVQPAAASAVAITTTVDGKPVLEQTVLANGTPQPISQGGCQGTQTSEWSRDGERLFTRAEIECADRPKRTVSGMMQLAKGHWIEAQATLIDGDHDVRLRRFRRATDQVIGGAAPAGGPMSVEDVIEASAKVLSPVVEAVLVESGGRFTLNSRTLTQLADAGVSPNVIDLMVAQAYPDRFQVERPSSYPPAPYTVAGAQSSGNTTVFLGSSAYPFPTYDPFYSSYYYYSPFAYPYYWGSSYYPYGYRYGSSFGYRNYYNNYYYGYPAYGATVPRPGNYGSHGSAQPGSPDAPGGDAIAVKGRGYTRVRPSSGSSDSGSGSAPAQRPASSGRGARVSSGSESSSPSSEPSSSSGSSGGSTSGGGYSSGGNSGGGGGRTAQPR